MSGTCPGRGDPVPWEREIDEAQCGDNWKDARLGGLGTSPRTLTDSVLRPVLLLHFHLVPECQAAALTAGLSEAQRGFFGGWGR